MKLVINTINKKSCSVSLPDEGTALEANYYEADRDEVGSAAFSHRQGGDKEVFPTIEDYIEIVHDGDVDRARIMPQNRLIIASRMSNNSIGIFDTSNHRTVEDDDVCRPELHGLVNDKFASAELVSTGLCWNVLNKTLLSTSPRGVYLWDLQMHTKFHATKSVVDAPKISPLSAWSVTEEGYDIIDCAFSAFSPHLFTTCHTLGLLKLWDARQKENSNGGINITIFKNDINCVAFSPFKEHLIACGGDEASVRLFDTRKTLREVSELKGHADKVMQVVWSPFHECVLASGSSDRRVNIWNLEMIGKEPDKGEDGDEDVDPALIFSHGGHRAGVVDVCWSKTEDWVLASTSEDCITQVWLPDANIIDEEGGGEEEEDGEEKNKKSEHVTIEVE